MKRTDRILMASVNRRAPKSGFREQPLSDGTGDPPRSGFCRDHAVFGCSEACYRAFRARRFVRARTTV